MTASICADAGGGDQNPSERGVIGEGEHRPGFLHFPKKPFVANGARCDLSTAQVLVHACVRHFWGRPESTRSGRWSMIAVGQVGWGVGASDARKPEARALLN